MTPKFCGKCGNELKENAKFCPNCGSKVEEAMEEESVKKTLKQGQDSHKNTPDSNYYEKKDKKSSKQLVPIIVIAISIVVIAVMSYLIFDLYRDRNEASSIASSTELDGEWYLMTRMESAKVNGEDSSDYEESIGEKTFSKMIIKRDEGIARVTEKATGTEIPMQVTIEKNNIQIGADTEESSSNYKYIGKISETEEGQMIEGEWEASLKDGEETIALKGNFIAEKLNPLISEDIRSKAVSIEEAELQGRYSGEYTFTRIENLESAPEEEFPREQVEFLESIEGKPLESRVVVEDGGIEIYATTSKHGENKMIDIDLVDFESGVFDSLELEEDEEIDRGIMRVEAVTLKEDGMPKIIGEYQIRIVIEDKKEIIMQSRFESIYEGSIED